MGFRTALFLLIVSHSLFAGEFSQYCQKSDLTPDEKETFETLLFVANVQGPISARNCDAAEKVFLSSKELFISVETTNNPNVEEKNFSWYVHRLKTFAPIATLTHIENLSATTYLTDLAPLRAMKNLKSLSLNPPDTDLPTPFLDLEPLRDLPQLTSLSLRMFAPERGPAFDVKALSEISTLEHLQIGDCAGISDWRSLADLNHLLTLIWTSSGFSRSGRPEPASLEGLSEMPSVQELTYYFGSKSSLDAVKSFPKVRNLKIFGFSRGGNDLEALRGLRELRDVSITFHGVKQLSLSPLSGKANLVSVSVLSLGFFDEQVEIEDLDALATSLKLKKLNLSGGSLKPEGLKKLTSLTSLGFQFKNWPSAANAEITYLTNLEELSLVRSSVTDTILKGLPVLPNLKSIDLAENNITDIAPLAQFKKLASIHLWGNTISSLEPLARLQDLESLVLAQALQGRLNEAPLKALLETHKNSQGKSIKLTIRYSDRYRDLVPSRPNEFSDLD